MRRKKDNNLPLPDEAQPTAITSKDYSSISGALLVVELGERRTEAPDVHSYEDMCMMRVLREYEIKSIHRF